MKKDILFKAIDFATEAHKGQYRKMTHMPYIVHVLSVGRFLARYNQSDEVIAAGILHDTLEDTKVTALEIEKNFSKKIRKLVESITEPSKKNNWETRKKHTLKVLEKAPLDTLYISCCDNLDNVNQNREDYIDMGEKLWEKLNAPQDKQQWYYTTLAKLFLKKGRRNKDFGKLANRFKEAVDDLFK